MERIENVEIRTDYQANGKGDRLFWIGQLGADGEHAPCVLTLDSARMVLQSMWDDPESLFDRLTEFVDREEDAIRAATVPDKTLEFDGTTYGLFRDGSIKSRFERDGRTMWRIVTGRMSEILSAETFDNPESLAIPVKPASRSSGKLAELQAKLDAQAEQTAQFQAMMMQFMRAQMAK